MKSQSTLPFYLLNHHLSGETIIVHDNWVYDGDFYHASECDQVSAKRDETLKKSDIALALSNKAKPFDLLKLPKLHFSVRNNIEYFIFKYMQSGAFKALPTPSSSPIYTLIINTQNSKMAYWYCHYVDNDPDIRQVIINTKGGQYAKWAFQYFCDVSEDEDMRQIILDAQQLILKDKNCGAAKTYINYTLPRISPNGVKPPKLVELIIDKGEDYTLFEYCKDIEDNAPMREKLRQKGDLHWLVEYYIKVNNHPDIRQAILDHNDPYKALACCENLKFDDPDMRQIITNSKNPDLAYAYCRWVADHEELRQVIVNSDISRIAYDYALNVSPHPDILKILKRHNVKLPNEKEWEEWEEWE